MDWLFDTDTVIYYLNGMERVVTRFEATRPGSRHITLITLGELYFGIYRSEQIDKNLRRYRQLFRTLKLVPFTPAVSEHFGTIKAHLADRGEMIGDHDIWIAAHALVHGATLLTNNVRDFRRIPELRIQNWTA